MLHDTFTSEAYEYVGRELVKLPGNCWARLLGSYYVRRRNYLVIPKTWLKPIKPIYIEINCEGIILLEVQ